jgi:Ner family transcriptional regulator
MQAQAIRATEPMSNADWSGPRIVYELRLRGWSLRSLSVKSGLAPTTLGDAVRKHRPGYEQIIARAIGVRPEVIWPSRYQTQ